MWGGIFFYLDIVGVGVDIFKGVRRIGVVFLGNLISCFIFRG